MTKTDGSFEVIGAGGAGVADEGELCPEELAGHLSTSEQRETVTTSDGGNALHLSGLPEPSTLSLYASASYAAIGSDKDKEHKPFYQAHELSASRTFLRAAEADRSVVGRINILLSAYHPTAQPTEARDSLELQASDLWMNAPSEYSFRVKDRGFGQPRMRCKL